MFCCIDFGSTVLYNITLERNCIHIVNKLMEMKHSSFIYSIQILHWVIQDCLEEGYIMFIGG